MSDTTSVYLRCDLVSRLIQALEWCNRERLEIAHRFDSGFSCDVTDDVEGAIAAGQRFLHEARPETALPPIEPGELPAFGLIQAWVKRLGLSASLYNQRLLAHDLTDLFGASRPETTAEQELYDEAYRLAWNSARHACITACIGALTGSEAREQIESMVNKLPTPTGSEGT
jgi:hypothetical protein